MSSTHYLHPTNETRSDSPKVEISVMSDYVTLKVAVGRDDVAFFVHPREGETMDQLVARLNYECRPSVR